jgi:hypothetical protein
MPALRRLRLLPLFIALTLCAVSRARAEGRGQAEIASQGYYMGGTQDLSATSGAAFRFRQFLPGLGLLSGSAESYGYSGHFKTGESFLELRGVPALGQRWNFLGGDFAIRNAAGELPASNIFNPEILVRGGRVEAAHGGRSYSLFYGVETVLEGPRIPFRASAGQRIAGAQFRQRFGERLSFGARFLRLMNDASNPDAQRSFGLYNRRFESASTASLQALYSISQPLRVFGEVSASSVAGAGVRAGPLSSMFGAEFDTPRLTLRANWVNQGAFYLPVAGYFTGDRRGPFASVRVHPWSWLDVSGSVNDSRNNRERDPDVPTFRSKSATLGATVKLPLGFSLSGSAGAIRFTTDSSATALANDSMNRYASATLARSFRRHSLRFSVSQMRLAMRDRVQRQLTREFEDMFTWRRLTFGGAVRLNSDVSEQRRNTLYGRGTVQVRLKRVTGYAFLEAGNDLVNRTVFATTAVRSSMFGFASPLLGGWTLHVEGFRNTLAIALNPENVFLLESRGLGFPAALGGLNQWSVFFRVVRQFQWGGPLPSPEGIDQFVARQAPLTGLIEGFVYNLAGGRRTPAANVPVWIDGSRLERTDERGRFGFADVPEGPHKVALALKELPANFEPGPIHSVQAVVEARKTVRAELEVVSLGRFCGTVRAPAGTALDGVLLRLRPGTRYTTPDPDGAFCFYNLREGDYQVELDPASLPELTRLVSAASVPVALRLAGDPPSAEFVLEAPKQEPRIRRVIDLGQTAVEPAQPRPAVKPPAEMPKPRSAVPGRCGELKNGVLTVRPCSELTVSPEDWFAGRSPDQPGPRQSQRMRGTKAGGAVRLTASSASAQRTRPRTQSLEVR